MGNDLQEQAKVIEHHEVCVVSLSIVFNVGILHGST